MTPLRIHLLTDGKPGHENQSLGLIEAIACLTPIELTTLPIRDQSLIASILHPGRGVKLQPNDSLLVGAGHSVHPAMLSLARKSGAPCVVLMKPSLPVALFDLCLIPRHDLGARDAPPNVIATRGALNRVPPPDDRPRHGGLILIGGPSSTHGWNSDQLAEALEIIVTTRSSLPWRITNSRRTPVDDLDRFVRSTPALAAYPFQETGRDWLPQRLAEAAEVWVTEDSVSMIYEALSSGGNVGLLPVPRIKAKGRVLRGIDQLVSDGFVTPFPQWTPGSPLPPPPLVLNEAGRCAELVLARFHPARLVA